MAITTTSKRVTKAMRFEDIKALLNGFEVATVLLDSGEVQPRTTLEDALAFCDAEIALLAKKNSADKKPTAKQKENETYKELILAFLAEQTEGVTCTEIRKAIPDFAAFENQKIAALVKQLAEAGKVVKEKVKNQMLISLA